MTNIGWAVDKSQQPSYDLRPSETEDFCKKKAYFYCLLFEREKKEIKYYLMDVNL